MGNRWNKNIYFKWGNTINKSSEGKSNARSRKQRSAGLQELIKLEKQLRSHRGSLACQAQDLKQCGRLKASDRIKGRASGALGRFIGGHPGKEGVQRSQAEGVGSSLLETLMGKCVNTRKGERKIRKKHNYRTWWWIQHEGWWEGRTNQVPTF